MATLNRLRVDWGGTVVVGPGLSTFYFTGSMAGVPAAVVALYTALITYAPSGLQWTIPSSGDTIEDSTGALTGGWTASGGSTVNATGSGAWAAGAGARIVWGTGSVFRGRRVKGATFFCPVTTGTYDTAGTLLNSFVTAANTAAANFVSATTPNFKIYSRPHLDGTYATSQVTSGSVPDKVSWLRSRRV